MKSIVTKDDWVLVAKSPIYTVPDLSTKNCIFINNNDGSMRGDNQNGCTEPINGQVFYACRKDAPCSYIFHLLFNINKVICSLKQTIYQFKN